MTTPSVFSSSTGVDKIENWDPDTFASIIAVVRHKPDDEMSNLCRFTFLPKGCEVFVSSTGDGALVYDQAGVEIIKTRYAQAIQSIDEMIKQGFTIIRLEIANRRGMSGTSFTFLTPQNRQHKMEYLRDNNAPETLIPDDFLYDLKMFPSRFG